MPTMKRTTSLYHVGLQMSKSMQSDTTIRDDIPVKRIVGRIRRLWHEKDVAVSATAMLETRGCHAGKLIWHIILVAEESLRVISQMPSTPEVACGLTVPGTISMRLQSKIPHGMLIDFGAYWRDWGGGDGEKMGDISSCSREPRKSVCMQRTAIGAPASAASVQFPNPLRRLKAGHIDCPNTK